MVYQKQYACYSPWTGTDGSLTVASETATATRTSEWFDVANWENKVISWEIDGADASPDVAIVAHISSQDNYELNNKTASTEDYVAVTIAANHTDGVYTRKDTTDFDDLQRPIRSIRFVITNNIEEVVSGITLKIEGWS